MSGAAAALWSRAVTVAALLAVDTAGLGGVTVRAGAGPVRDRWLALLRALLPAGVPWRRLPPTIAEGRLLGGLDLAATLAAGRPVAERGLLASADGGVVIVPMAERLPACVAGPLCAALDTGTIAVERDGLALRLASSFAAVLLDEGVEAERAPAAVVERLAFLIDLDGARPDSGDDPMPTGADIAAARERFGAVAVDDAMMEALCGVGLALGVDSLRVSSLALRAARAAAALAGRDRVAAEDVTLAATLVVAPRATRVPPQAVPEPDASRDETSQDETSQDETRNPGDPASEDPPAPGAEPQAEECRSRTGNRTGA